MRPSRGGFSLPSPEERNRSIFRNFFYIYLEFQTKNNPGNAVIPGGGKCFGSINDMEFPKKLTGFSRMTLLY
jgi:hypothetical protein